MMSSHPWHMTSATGAWRAGPARRACPRNLSHWLIVRVGSIDRFIGGLLLAEVGEASSLDECGAGRPFATPIGVRCRPHNRGRADVQWELEEQKLEEGSE